MAVRKEYRAELEKLKADVLRMGELSKAAAENAIRALVDHDKELASELIEENRVIDKMEFDIENLCMKLLALQQQLYF